MKSFNDLNFKPHKATIPKAKQQRLIAQGMAKDSNLFKPMLQAIIDFPNKQSVSVLFGPMFYSNGIDTYEIWSSLDDEPIGYLTKDEITEVIQRTENH